MRALLLSIFVAATACGSSSSSSTPDAPPAKHDGGTTPTRDAADATGFHIDIGSPYASAAAVTIAAVSDDGVYSGYYTAQSDFGTTPSLSVSIHADSATLATGAYPCARSTDSNDADETAVTIQWLDGNTYYTNLMPSPSCTITITSASQTEVDATITGTIYNESDETSTAFTASFHATVSS